MVRPVYALGILWEPVLEACPAIYQPRPACTNSHQLPSLWQPSRRPHPPELQGFSFSSLNGKDGHVCIEITQIVENLIPPLPL